MRREPAIALSGTATGATPKIYPVQAAYVLSEVKEIYMKEARFAMSVLTLCLLGHAAAQRAPAVEITATTKGYQAPAQLPSGFVQMNFKNDGVAPIEMQLFKLKSGVTAETLKRAVTAFALGSQTHQGDMAALEAAMIKASDLYGGAQQLPPKATYTMTVNLEPGNYVLTTTSTNNAEKILRRWPTQDFSRPSPWSKGPTRQQPQSSVYGSAGRFCPGTTTYASHRWNPYVGSG
ncbi:hypothetical protein ACFSC4_05145 [Deinococcus malanensis]|uniref:hypothetical protein n=1 Tax=Deinococcus malanensis TaxID=1706855 RepID=UPI0036413989